MLIDLRSRGVKSMLNRSLRLVEVVHKMVNEYESDTECSTTIKDLMMEEVAIGDFRAGVFINYVEDSGIRKGIASTVNST